MGKEGWGRLLATGKEWVGGKVASSRNRDGRSRLLATGNNKVGKDCELQRKRGVGRLLSTGKGGEKGKIMWGKVPSC